VTTASVRPDIAGIDRAHASVVPTLRGLPWYGAVLVALILTVIGAVIGGSDFGNGVPPAIWICFLVGVILAVLAVRRQAVFTAMVQPPLIGAAVILLAARIIDGQAFVFSGINVVKCFPLLAVGTGIAVIVGLVRIVAQPLRRTSTPAAGPVRRAPAGHSATSDRLDADGRADSAP
jgi:hypothetical protein